MDANLLNHVEVHRLITSALRGAGVVNVRRIEVPDGTDTPGSVFLEDSSTTRAAVQALKSVPGVTRVRRRRHMSQELLFQVAPDGLLSARGNLTENAAGRLPGR